VRQYREKSILDERKEKKNAIDYRVPIDSSNPELQICNIHTAVEDRMFWGCKILILPKS